MKKCKDCKKEISSTATRCQSCAKKGKLNSFYNKHHTKKIKKKMSLLKQGIFLGENNPNYKYGKCCKKYYCKKCNIGANRDRNYWFAYFTYIMENLLCS